jgi:hypothetical protein
MSLLVYYIPKNYIYLSALKSYGNRKNLLKKKMKPGVWLILVIPVGQKVRDPSPQRSWERCNITTILATN